MRKIRRSAAFFTHFFLRSQGKDSLGQKLLFIQKQKPFIAIGLEKLTLIWNFSF
jgi:hypothetical protein